jgi:hypothetical protein
VEEKDVITSILDNRLSLVEVGAQPDTTITFLTGIASGFGWAGGSVNIGPFQIGNKPAAVSGRLSVSGAISTAGFVARTLGGSEMELTGLQVGTIPQRIVTLASPAPIKVAAMEVTFSPPARPDTRSGITREAYTVDPGQPAWQFSALKKLSDLVEEHHSAKSHHLQPGAQGLAAKLIRWVEVDDLPVPAISVGCSGTIWFQWNYHGRQLKVEIASRQLVFLQVFADGLVREIKAARNVPDTCRTLARWLVRGEMTEEMYEYVVAARKGSILAKLIIDRALESYRRPTGYEGSLVEAAWQLEEIGPPSWPVLRELLRSMGTECEYFLAAVVRLEGIAPQYRLSALLDAARNPDANVRSRLLELLDEMSGDVREQVLRELTAIDRPDDSVTDQAREAMQQQAC